ncbi:MAG TPA: NifU family protein [bacterium]|nr:NifU family protein [bacterium]
MPNPQWLQPLRRWFAPKDAPAAAALSAAPAAGTPPAEAPPAPSGPPLQVSHVWAAEPNALKLQVNRLLLPLGQKRTFTDPSQAQDAPLAQALFAIGGLQSVEIDSAFVTVLMAEDADWDPIMERVPQVLKAHLESGQPAVLAPEAPVRRYKFGFQQVPSRTRDDQLRMLQEFFDTEVNPAVAAHGGHFTLLDVKDNRVFVELGGGCQGCGQADVTLRMGVEQRLREIMPEMVALVDVTDHAAGENPYYQAEK